MAGLAELERSLLEILWRLRPYLTEIVVIGGWVPHLYRRFGGFRTWKAELSLTGEVDALVSRDLPAGARPPIASLLSEAGFRPVTRVPAPAVWANNPEVGEKIEFLVDHSGPFRTVGRVQAVGEQPGLGAVALDGLWFLYQHVVTLDVFARPTGVGTERLQVRMPRLGAYVINKGMTFSRRQELAEGPNPKRAKDLLYIRDVMAAGDEVVGRIAGDVRAIVTSDRRSKRYARHAANNLRLLAAGTWGAELSEAGRMLVERAPGTSLEAAIADLRGHITDLSDVLEESGA